MPDVSKRMAAERLLAYHFWIDVRAEMLTRGMELHHLAHIARIPVSVLREAENNKTISLPLALSVAKGLGKRLALTLE